MERGLDELNELTRIFIYLSMKTSLIRYIRVLFQHN